jgi:hypothetical protein
MAAEELEIQKLGRRFGAADFWSGGIELLRRLKFLRRACCEGGLVQIVLDDLGDV